MKGGGLWLFAVVLVTALFVGSVTALIVLFVIGHALSA